MVFGEMCKRRSGVACLLGVFRMALLGDTGGGGVRVSDWRGELDTQASAYNKVVFFFCFL
jgi:hypothetical protein